MQKRITTLLIFMMLAISFTLIFPIENVKAIGNTLYVGGSGPGNYSSIQSAINNANIGDTVFVYNGTYYEKVIVNKTINLIGEDKNNTIIDGGGRGDVVNISYDWVSISGFTIRKNGNPGSGIKIHSSYNVIYGNIIKSKGTYGNFGLDITNSDSNIISGNIISYSSKGINLRNSCSNNISNNSIFTVWHYAIILHSSSNSNTITSNNINSSGYNGIHLSYYCNNNIISENNIKSNNFEGICIHVSKNNIITDNIVSNNKYGITITGSSSNNEVSGNNISNNQCGTNVESSSNNIFLDNNVSNNILGIHLYYSPSNTITSNIVSNNQYGINTTGSSDNNCIYHNNFIDNTQNAYDERSNTWDNGYPSGGNYWDDYTGVDVDGDGIGDTPYDIPGEADAQDLYPLMYPWGYEEPEIEGIIDISPNILNSKSKGKWFTCYIELPDGYDVTDIDINTILLNDVVSAEDHPTNIGDYDYDEIADLMVKFNRQIVMDILEIGDNVAITITGELMDGTRFEGMDYIRVK